MPPKRKAISTKRKKIAEEEKRIAEAEEEKKRKATEEAEKAQKVKKVKKLKKNKEAEKEQEGLDAADLMRQKNTLNEERAKFEEEMAKFSATRLRFEEEIAKKKDDQRTGERGDDEEGEGWLDGIGEHKNPILVDGYASDGELVLGEMGVGHMRGRSLWASLLADAGWPDEKINRVIRSMTTAHGVIVMQRMAKLLLILENGGSCAGKVPPAVADAARDWFDRMDRLIMVEVRAPLQENPYEFVDFRIFTHEGRMARAGNAGSVLAPDVPGARARNAGAVAGPISLPEYIKAAVTWLSYVGLINPLLLHGGLGHLINVLTLAERGLDYQAYDMMVRRNWAPVDGNFDIDALSLGRYSQATVDQLPSLQAGMVFFLCLLLLVWGSIKFMGLSWPHARSGGLLPALCSRSALSSVGDRQAEPALCSLWVGCAVLGT